MTRISLFSCILALLATVACGGGDPGQGSSGGASQTPASVAPSVLPADDGGAGAGEAGPNLLGDVPDDASLALDTTPPFQNPAAGDGACVAPDRICGAGDDAGLACVDVTHDVDNCGGCGSQCMGPSAACVGGQCACSQLGFLYCGPAAGGCIDTTSDVNNCGACGMVCDPSQFNACVGSLCVSQ